MPDEVDEYGIPIKKSQQQVDEFGIPVKKKEIGGFGSIAGGLIGTGGDGRSVSSRLVSGTIKKVKPVEKVEIAGIEDYNKNFRETTGIKAEEFDLGSDLPQIKKAREEKKYLQYRDIEENELKPVVNAVRTGTASPKQLQELYSQPYGRKVVSDVIKSELPELADIGGLDPEIVNSGEKWQEISKRLQEKNRPAGVEAQNQSEFALDNELDNTFKNFTYGKEELIEGARKGDPRQLKETKIPFGDVNTTSPTDLMAVLDRIGNMPYVFDASGNRKSTKELKEKIQERIFQLKSTEQINPEIYGNKEMILDAVSKVPVEWKRKGGDNPELTSRDTDYVMQGLNYIRDLQPGRYGIIMATIEKTGKISEQDFTDLANMGKSMQYFRDFKEGKYVEPDDRPLFTAQLKQASLAGWLSERLKQMGKTKRAAVPQKDILAAYQDAPEELKDEELLRNIINKERAPSFGFLPIAQGEGITKTGGLPSFMRGVASPFKSVVNSAETTFDSPFESYLKSKELNRGNQLIPQKGGGYGDILPSEKFWNKASEGFGSFLSQLFLARGIGEAVKAPLNAVIGRVNPMATISSRDAMLNFGTPLSTLAISYGDEYVDFLEKTGSPTKAALGAFVSGLTQGVIERNIMPDILIAEKASLLLARKNFAKEVIDVVESGGGKAGIADVVKKFVANTTKMIGKEAWLEENLQNLTNYLTESVISPKTVQDRNLIKETVDTGNAATVMMLIPSLLGGAGETKIKRSLTKAQLNSIAANPQQYIEAIDNQFTLGQISKDEHELATKIISTQRDNINNSPRRDANGELISAERQLEYAYQSTVQQIAQEQAAKITDPIQKEPLEKKAEEADKIKRQIFYGEENKELPSKEGEPIAIDQDRDLMDEGEITPESAIQNAIESGQLKGGNLMSAQAALGMEGGAQMFLQEVADQALNKQGEPATDAENMKRARETYGDELVDMAIAQYPKEVAAKESGISVQMPQEVSKPQTTEIKPAEPIEEDITAFVEVTRPELGFEELPTDILDNMDSKTMAVQGKRLEGLNKNLEKLKELFECIWS